MACGCSGTSREQPTSSVRESVSVSAGARRARTRASNQRSTRSSGRFTVAVPKDSLALVAFGHELIAEASGGRPQRGFRIHVEFARERDGREKQIADVL